MMIKSAVLILSLMLCTSVQATTVFSPTDTNVNFIQLSGVDNALIGLFEDNDTGFAGDYLSIQASASGDQVHFTPSGGDYLLTNAYNLTPGSMTLLGSADLILAIWSPLLAGWVGLETAYCNAISASCSVDWPTLPLVTLVVDVTQVQPMKPTIPLPTSFTLLACGLLGMTVVGRRRVIFQA